MKQGLYLLSDAMETSAENLLKKAEKYLKNKKPDAFLCRIPQNCHDKKNFVRCLQRFFQEKEIAFLVDDVDFCDSTDGVQLDFQPQIALWRKKYADLTLGIVCKTRHEAMIAGEKGADYIAFTGEKSADLCNWWSDLFTVPCVYTLTGKCEKADFITETL